MPNVQSIAITALVFSILSFIILISMIFVTIFVLVPYIDDNSDSSPNHNVKFNIDYPLDTIPSQINGKIIQSNDKILINEELYKFVAKKDELILIKVHLNDGSIVSSQNNTFMYSNNSLSKINL
jgi:hypothetical protein